VGPWANQTRVDCFAALTVVPGRLTTCMLEQPARSTAKTGRSKQQRRPAAFAVHRRDSARAYPATAYPAVVIPSDQAPWHRGSVIDQVLAADPPRQVDRLPSYRPQLNVMERFWRV